MKSIRNTTTQILGANESWTGLTEFVGDKHFISVSVSTDQNGTLTIEFSNDKGINYDHTETFNVTAGTPIYELLEVKGHHFKVSYTNEATPQTHFRLTTHIKNDGLLHELKRQTALLNQLVQAGGVPAGGGNGGSPPTPPDDNVITALNPVIWLEPSPYHLNMGSATSGDVITSLQSRSTPVFTLVNYNTPRYKEEDGLKWFWLDGSSYWKNTININQSDDSTMCIVFHTPNNITGTSSFLRMSSRNNYIMSGNVYNYSNFVTNHYLLGDTTYVLTHSINKSNNTEYMRFQIKNGSTYQYYNSGTVTDVDNDSLHIWFCSYGNGANWQDKVGDMILINSVDESDISTVETYLKSKYGFPVA